MSKRVIFKNDWRFESWHHVSPLLRYEHEFQVDNLVQGKAQGVREDQAVQNVVSVVSRQ
jgi:hypothetical protein